jgi:hypothetical protein
MPKINVEILMDGALKPFYFNYSFTLVAANKCYLRCNEYRCMYTELQRNEGKKRGK